MLTCTSAFIAVARPLLKLTDRIKKLEEICTSYALLDHDYNKLAQEIQQEDEFGAAIQLKHRVLMDRSDDLKQKETVVRQIDESLRKRCREAVESELPVSRFFIPSK